MMSTNLLCQKNNLYLLGSSLTPIYLFEYKPKKWLLADGGLSRDFDEVLDQLQHIVEHPEDLDYWLITHAHYDHCGTLPYLLPHFPNVVIVCSKLAKAKLSDSIYCELMCKFDSQAGYGESQEKVLDISGNEIRSYEPGDHVFLKGVECTLIDARGHSDDLVAFWFPKEKILFCGDALGDCLMGRIWRPLIFFDVEKYMQSINRIRSLPVSSLLLGHHFFIGEKVIDDALAKCNSDTLHLVNSIKTRLNSGETIGFLSNELVKEIYPSVKYFITKKLLTKSFFHMVSLIDKEATVGDHQEQSSFKLNEADNF